jgi:hypothetical protein
MRRPAELRTTLPFSCVPPNSIRSTHNQALLRCSNSLGTGGTGTSQKQKVNFWQMDSDSGFQKKEFVIGPRDTRVNSKALIEFADSIPCYGQTAELPPPKRPFNSHKKQNT